MHIGNGRETPWKEQRERVSNREGEREREREKQECAGSNVVCYGYPFAMDGN